MKTKTEKIKSKEQIIVQEIQLSKIEASNYNPRKTFNEKAIEELAQSIRTEGLISPIMVRPKGDKFEIVYGERRYRASKLLKGKTILAIVKNLTDEEAEDRAITENLMREDVSPLEEARAFNRLVKKGKYDVKSLSEHFGRSIPHIYGRLKLNNLIPEFEELFESNILRIGVILEIANYAHETQKIAFDEHFSEEVASYQSWRIQKSSDIVALMERHYSLHLAHYECIQESCAGCIHNSGTASLFSDSKSVVCYNINCLREKVGDFVANMTLAILADNPLLPIETSHRSNTLAIKILEDKGHTLENYNSYPLTPEKPVEPIKTGYDKDGETYREDLEQYNADLKEYEKDMSELMDREERGEVYKSIRIMHASVSIEYMETRNSSKGVEENIDSSDNPKIKQYKQEIAKSESQIKREKEICRENTRSDYKAVCGEVAVDDNELSELEVKLLYIAMLASLDRECLKKLGVASNYGISDDERQSIFDDLTESKKIIISKGFIVQYLSRAYSISEENMLYSFLEQYCPADRQEIEDKYNAVMNKRIANHESKIEVASAFLEVHKNIPLQKEADVCDETNEVAE